METVELERLFVKISRIGEYKRRKGYMTAEQEKCEREEWEKKRMRNGIKRFKRKTLGWFNEQTIKSLDEMAHWLYDTRIVSSVEEGRELSPRLVGRRITYPSLFTDFGEIEFNLVTNEKGEQAYEIRHIRDHGAPN